MAEHGVQPFIAYLGTLIQLGGALLLAGLFFLLRTYAHRRKYFLIWGKGWIALILAMLAVVIRYRIVPNLEVALPDDSGLEVKILNATYQYSKLLFYALLVAGTATYTRGSLPTNVVPVAGISAALYTILALFYARDINQMVTLQAPVAAFAAGWCAFTIGMLPRSRRTLGNLTVASVMAGMAVLWTVYFLAFGVTGPMMPEYPGPQALGFLVRYNSFFDCFIHLALGYGMIVLLMEEAKREADDAHSELAVAHDELRRASLYDSVTGSMNRRAFEEGIGLEAARATFGTVMMLDMDNLKAVNDRHGHAAGDSLLRYLVEVLRSTLRSSDKLYRWGGDEFLIVFPGADHAHMKRRMENLLLLSRPLNVGAQGKPVSLMVSLGTSRYASAEEFQAAIERADAEMYRDKYRRKAERVAELVPLTASR
jgi:diguanylate cyclase (GGDEF)-like protein